jgi:uncharacterized OsmC-like protein
VKVSVKSGPLIEVATKNHIIQYATDGSLPNPLESVYACIAGCAAVFAKKACHDLGVNEDGIEIELKAIGDKAKLGAIGKITINMAFPEHISVEQRSAIIASVEKCPVKALIEQGGSIEFVII